MNKDRADLAEKYNVFSDDEMLRLLASGNLTELAHSVALAEIKLRNLQFSSNVENYIEFKEINNIDPTMQVIAEKLTTTEASILCGLLHGENIPADTGYTSNIQIPSPFPTSIGNAIIRVPPEFAMQAMDVMHDYQSGKFQLEDNELSDQELINEPFDGSSLSDKTEKTIEKPEPHSSTISSAESAYKTSESYWVGIFLLLIVFVVAVIAYQNR